MKFSLLLIHIALQSVHALPAYATADVPSGSIDTWAPAGPDDFRGPCPMMNTLANHGFIPHDGRNITEEVLVSALEKAVSFDPVLGKIMFEGGVVANPEPNATFFTLEMLNVHNVLEHDGSLSRQDAYFGNNHVFNETIFDESMTFWSGDVLDAQMMAMSKVGRQAKSKALNPTYRFTESIEQFSRGEVSAPIIVFGDLETSTVDRDLVEYFFRNERLPSELGWVKKTELVTLEAITVQSQRIADNQGLLTADNSTSGTPHKRRLVHSAHGLDWA